MRGWLLGIVGAIIAGVVVWWLTVEENLLGFVPSSYQCSAGTKKQVDLAPAKGEWGKPVSGSSGKVVYCDDAPPPFTGRLDFSALELQRNYRITLNGIPGRPGNDRLEKTLGNERYSDFDQYHADVKGSGGGEFKWYLRAGRYEVKFFLKDTDGWKIVLYNDFFAFTIQ